MDYWFICKKLNSISSVACRTDLIHECVEYNPDGTERFELLTRLLQSAADSQWVILYEVQVNERTH